MRRINYVFQEILKVFLYFLFIYVWIRYLIRNSLLAILVSAFCAGTIWLVSWIIFTKKSSNEGLKLKEKESAENMFFSLACDQNYLEFFRKLALKKHEDVKVQDDFLIINHKNEGVSTILYPDFSYNGLDVPRFMEIYGKIKMQNATKIVVLCKNVSDKNLYNFLLNFKEKIMLLDEYETYQKLYKYYDFFPEITHQIKKEKKAVLKDLIAYSFNKKRTKGYLFSALVLILSGLFVRQSIYYCVVASLLVVFAIISQFNPRFNTKIADEIL